MWRHTISCFLVSVLRNQQQNYDRQNDEHSEVLPPEGSEINIWGIIYIYTRTRAQTETQSLTYGGSAHLIWCVGFGVLVDGLTTAPTLWTCDSLCRVFVCSWFSLRREEQLLPTFSHFCTQVGYTTCTLCIFMRVWGVILMLFRSMDINFRSDDWFAIVGSIGRRSIASLTNNWMLYEIR